MVRITAIDDKPIPGDDLLISPRKIVSHAITINVRPEMVWPWLVQLGAGRAGWYSYDRIDNGGNPNARKIIPGLQHVERGDIFPAVPGTKDSFIISEVLPGKALILVVPVKSAAEDPDSLSRIKGPLRATWALLLELLDGDRTRLVSRARISTDWLAPSAVPADGTKSPIFIERIYHLLGKMPWSLMAPVAMTGHYIMERRMLRGIKKRAEASIYEAK